MIGSFSKLAIDLVPSYNEHGRSLSCLDVAFCVPVGHFSSASRGGPADADRALTTLALLRPGKRGGGLHREERPFGTISAHFSGAEAVNNSRRPIMLYWSLVFLVIALVAGLLGFTGIYVAAAGIAKILFFIFIVLLLVSLLAGGLRRGPPIA
jgi:uncharacterized membrane protein YtjA (UPF0391 family)